MEMKVDLEKLNPILQTTQEKKGSLIPVLQKAQGLYGYLPELVMEKIAEVLKISRAEVFGVATFYTQFRFTRPGDHTVRMCLGTACHVRGGSQIMDEISRYLGITAGQTTPDHKFSIERVACFGSCALAPVVVVDNKVYGRMSPRKVKKILKEFE